MAHAGGRLISGEAVGSIFNSKKDFDTEKQMSAYIEANIELFCKDVLGDVYKRHEREYIFTGRCAKRDVSSARIDFMIYCENGTYAVEVKNPHQRYAELAKAIGQVMVYEFELSQRGSKAQVILVSSAHNDFICQMINRYNLPIRYVVLNREYTAEYVRKAS